MKDNKDLEETRSKPVVDPARQGGPQKMDEGRRRIAKAGLLAPVILTLASRPSWGANCTVSGMYSGNLSNPTDSCEGNSPAFWRQASWTTTSYSKDTLFSQVFSPSPNLDPMDPNYDLYHNGKLGEVIGLIFDSGLGWSDPGTIDKTNETLGAHTVAALLNAADPSINFGYEPADIIGFFNLYHDDDPEGLREDFMLLNSRSGI